MDISIGIYGNSTNKSILSFYNNKPDTFCITLLETESDLIKQTDLDYLIMTKDDVSADILNQHFSDIKIIKWVLDNEFARFTTEIVVNKTDNTLINTYNLAEKKIFSEIWVPTHLKYSLEYYKHVYHIDNIYIIPFLWDVQKKGHLGPFKKNTINIAIIEPNKDITRNCIQSIMDVHKIGTHVDKVFVFNALNRLPNAPLFRKYIQRSPLLGKKMFFTGNMEIYLQTECNVVLSFSENNDLSHLAFECFYYGIPFIHNSALLKDWGFYYESYDYDKIKEHINNIKESFDRNKYIEEHKPVLYSASMKNMSIVNYFKEKLKPIENRCLRDRKHKWFLSRKDLSEKSWISNFEAFSNNSWKGNIKGDEITQIDKNIQLNTKIPTFILINNETLSIKLLLSVQNNYHLVEGETIKADIDMNSLVCYNHIKMWNKALESKIDTGAFFIEDDIKLIDNWKSIMQDFINKKTPKVVKFIAKPERIFDNSDNIRFFDCWGPFGIKGYYMSKDVIKECINYFKNHTITRPFELVLSEVLQQFYKSIYSSYPKLGI